MHGFVVFSLTFRFKLLRELFLLFARLACLKEETVPGRGAHFGLKLIEFFVGSESQVVLTVAVDGSKQDCDKVWNGE